MNEARWASSGFLAGRTSSSTKHPWRARAIPKRARSSIGARVGYSLCPTKYTTPARATMLTRNFPPPPITTEEQERDRELASAGRDLFHRLGLGPFGAGDYLKLHLIPFV